MPKKAFLVTFVPRTRVVFDVPEGFDPDRNDKETDRILLEIIDKARGQMADKLDNYLCADNLDSIEEDEECPYEESEDNRQ